MDKLTFVGISSSPRNANTNILVKKTLDSMKEEAERNGYEAETKFISFKGKKILPCINCDACVRKKTHCILKDDWLDIAKQLIDPVPNGLVLGSPVYFYNVNSTMRAFMERCTSLVKGIWDPEFPYPVPNWDRTAAGAVTVGYDRNGGQGIALTTMLQFLILNGFVTVNAGHTGGYIGVPGWQMGEEGTVRNAVLKDDNSLIWSERLGIKLAKTSILLAGKSLKE